MKYILFLLLSVFTSNAQITKEQLDLMPWPQKIDINIGNFALSKNFKVNITGNPKWSDFHRSNPIFATLGWKNRFVFHSRLFDQNK